MKVLVSDRLSAEGLRVFEEIEGLELNYLPGVTYQELVAAIADVDALVVRAGTQVDEDLLAAANRLRVIGRAGIGVENIDMAAANRKGVVVMNTPFGSATTSAEHTLAMLMATARCIPQASSAVHSGKWHKEPFIGVEIAGKTLGIVGAGKIGRLVLERAVALKMRVLVHDPYVGADVVSQLGGEQVSFQDVVEKSDFITLHVPLNAETANLLDEEALSRVKPGCRIINCAQGGLVDEAALAKALVEGRIAGAAFDVFAKEPPDRDNPLLGLSQVVCTPHIRTSSVDAQINVSVQIARQIVDFLRRGIVVNALNVPSISAELLGKIRPFVTLAEKLGSFQAQLCPHGLKKLTIEYAGEVADQPSAPLTMALLKGLMGPIVGETVNYVNAPHLVRERGINVVEIKSQSAEGFSNLIRLTVDTAEEQRCVAGAVFGHEDYRLVQVGEYPLEAVPEGHILVLYNTDRPGVIAFIGQVLAEAEINIAMMNLSRRKIEGQAVSLITIDTPAPPEVLEKLRANANITSAVQVTL